MSFQRLMDHLFLDLPFVFVYLNNMLIVSRSAEEHRRHLREALQRLQDNGLILNTDKCMWRQQSLEFLGHKVSAAGISPLPTRVAAIQDFPLPQSIQQLQAYLGLFNFYRQLIHAAAKLVKPLTYALAGSAKGLAAIRWSAEMTAAFKGSKQALAAATLLDHPAMDTKLSLVTEASLSGGGWAAGDL
jgi:Reverse transcriptase (RNA-dependent DNA polymerase)